MSDVPTPLMANTVTPTDVMYAATAAAGLWMLRFHLQYLRPELAIERVSKYVHHYLTLVNRCDHLERRCAALQRVLDARS